MLISKNHLKARFTASKDKTRPLLTVVDIKVEDKEVVAVATDGYTLSEIREETPSDLDFPGELSTSVNKLRIQAETAASISTSIKKNQHLPILNYTHAGVDGITTTDLSHAQLFTENQVEGEYPDYKKLIPETKSAIGTVKINPAYLATMAKLFSTEHEVTIELHGKNEALVFRSSQDGHDIMGVVMPLRG